MGWCWHFCEFIFLARNWVKDQKIIADALDAIVDHDYPNVIFMLCEGTRYTKEKYDASVEFAKNNDLPMYKHHLVPRAKGFNHSVMHLAKQGKLPAIYNVQVAFTDERNKNVQPTLKNILLGKPLIGDVYIGRIPIEQIPWQSETELTKFLFELYSEKDILMDGHKETAKFPGIYRCPNRRLVPLLNFAMWTVIVSYLIYCLMAISFTWFVSILSILLTSIFVVGFMVNATKAEKGSKYGKKKD